MLNIIEIKLQNPKEFFEMSWNEQKPCAGVSK